MTTASRPPTITEVVARLMASKALAISVNGRQFWAVVPISEKEDKYLKISAALATAWQAARDEEATTR